MKFSLSPACAPGSDNGKGTVAMIRARDTTTTFQPEKKRLPLGLQRILFPAMLSLAVTGCGEATEPETSRWTETAAPAGAPVKQRWYTRSQVEAGAPLYREHCAACHKENAEGTENWRQRDANGNFPPPPLNGTAHTWHHPLDILRMVVRNGGAPVGGAMPAFGQKLDAVQVDAILAWVQSHWSDEIYGMWRERDIQSAGRSSPLQGG